MAITPYLTGLGPDGITISWEAPANRSYSVTVTPTAHAGGTVPQTAVRFQEHADGENGIYFAHVSSLDPDTEYRYQVDEGTHRASTGTFRTAPEQSDSAEYLVISDSHAFNLRKEIEQIALGHEWDAALHVGDLPAGTGYQKEQYASGWFDPFAKALASVPFVYVPGNHDDGPHFDTYFAHQSHGWSADSMGRSFSFTDGAGVHFIVIDSNPWGLTEMNAVNSGLSLSEEDAARVQEIQEWVSNDLAGESARSATWRVVLMHHPYTDILTNQRIVDILQDGDVDLVLTGHLHEYYKAVPLDGQVVPRPIFLTLPSCQDEAEWFKKPSVGERILSDFPEVVASGNGNYATLFASAQSLSVKVWGLRDGTSVLVDDVTLTKEDTENDLVFSSAALTWDGSAGEVEVSATAHNSGAGMVSVVPILVDNGTPQRIQLLGPSGSQRACTSLDADEELRVEFTYRPLSSGRHTIEFAGSHLLLDVPAEEDVRCGASVIDFDAELSLLTASVWLENPSDSPAAVTITLGWKGEETAATRQVTLAPHDGSMEQIVLATSVGGEHLAMLLVNGKECSQKEVDCGGTLAVVPRVKDRSGWRNDALVRGTPTRGMHQGRATLILSKDSDYLEIPPSPSLECANDFSGMVRARVDRLAHPHEMAHNPLLVRGKSVGWGATYFLRMVIDRNGVMKWGTCYGPNEYGWAGGRVNLGGWSDYAVEFSTERGGKSSIDAQVVAEVPPPPEGARLNDYSDMPLFVGYSYIGHLIEEIGRPMHFTHLPAEIESVQYSCSDPAAAKCGADMSDPLRVDLDLSDIDVSGSYVSAWRTARLYRSQFQRDRDTWEFTDVEIDADIPQGCQIVATVETSFDRGISAGQHSFTCMSGKDRYLLPPGMLGTHARLKLEMSGTAEMGQPLGVPTVRSCSLKAHQQGTKTQIRWACDKDWRDGEFSGAVGLPPVGRLHVFSEYSDPIHG